MKVMFDILVAALCFTMATFAGFMLVVLILDGQTLFAFITLLLLALCFVVYNKVLRG